MQGIDEAVKTLLRVDRKLDVKTLFETAYDKHIAAVTPAGFIELKTYSKPRNTEVAFGTLDGFIEYCRRVDVRGEIADIFIGENYVMADLDRNLPGKHIAACVLNKTTEYSSLITLENGVSQKKLWELLVQNLYSCFPESLLGYIGSIQSISKDDMKVTIDNTGLMSAAGAKSVSINFAGDGDAQNATLPIEWVWTGRVYESFDSSTEFNVRLVLSKTDNGLVFKFLIRDHVKVLNNTHAAMVEYISDSLKDVAGVNVYHGNFGTCDSVNREFIK